MFCRVLCLVAIIAAAFTSMTTEAYAQKKSVVCSTTQIADFARQIVGDDWDVKCVLAPGQNPHTYDPLIEDSDMVADCDLCLQNGWHLEGNEWMEKLAASNGKPIVTCVEGVQPIKIEEDESTINDPHAWFAPANAAIYVRNILAAVIELDPENAQKFTQRAELYMGQLNALDLWIKNQVVKIPAEHRVLVTHHDAFEYFASTYGFKAISPTGWSTEEMTGGNLERKQNVVNSIREIGVRSIFVETSLNKTMITQIAREAGVEIGGHLYSDAMGGSGTAGETYIGMMRENVITIVGALK